MQYIKCILASREYPNYISNAIDIVLGCATVEFPVEFPVECWISCIVQFLFQIQKFLHNVSSGLKNFLFIFNIKQECEIETVLEVLTDYTL